MPRQKSDHVDSAAALAERLRDARLEAGLSQRALARGICTPAYVSRLEKGERIPSLQLLRQLAERIGADADELACGVARQTRHPLLDAELALRLGETAEAELAFRDALDSGNPSLRARALAGLGQLAFDRGDHREAIALLEEADTARSASSSDPSLADTLGRAYALAGERESAIAIFEVELERARGRGDLIETTRFAVLLANALIDSGAYDRASELLGDALAWTSELRDPVVHARLWWTQSRLHTNQNDPDTAAHYAQRALEVLDLTEHESYAARAHQLLAHIELNRGRPLEALELLDSAYPLIERAGNRYERAMFDLERARALMQLDRNEEAAAVALSTTGAIGSSSPSDAGRGYGLVAQVFAELGDPERALELYELAEAFQTVSHHVRRDIATHHAALLEQLGRKDDALDVLKRAMGAASTSDVTR
ncbi:MAG: helix-turn-helix domain-containing protein [Gaiellaceae bacterium]